MKIITLIMIFTACRMFAADDTNLAAAGDWSQPVATQYGPAIRGRLLICDTPNHASPDLKPDTGVYLELQEFTSVLRPVRVYCGMNRFAVPDSSPGLRCELRDSAGKPMPPSLGGFSGNVPGSYWVTLQPYCSTRLRASVYGGGRLDDGGLAIYLCSSGTWWDVHPNKTNEYYLSGTFTAAMPTNQPGLQMGLPTVDSTNRDVWYGTLTLPGVKLPIKKP